jgi:magnesium-transporting ATPase (P-type)
MHESVNTYVTYTTLGIGFIYSSGVTSDEAEKLLHKYGLNTLPEKIVPKWYIFVSQLWQPMPIMIWAASIIEAAIQNWIDMAILLFIQFANASIGFYEITKAGMIIIPHLKIKSSKFSKFSHFILLPNKYKETRLRH